MHDYCQGEIQMNTITLNVDPELYEQVSAEAKARGQAMEEYSRELFESAFETRRKSSKQTARELLEAAGMLRPLGNELRKLIISDVPLDEIIEEMSKAGGPSLTEILQEHRGPKG
jgi:hypothetical protein